MCKKFFYMMRLTVLILIFNNHSLAHETSIIYVIPEDPSQLNDRFFSMFSIWGKIRKQLYEEAGYLLKTPSEQQKDTISDYCYHFSDIDHIKYIIDLTPYNFFTRRYGEKYLEKIILFLWEPPVVNPDSYDKKLHERIARVFTWDDDLVDNKKYYKIYYPVFHKWRFDIPTQEQFEAKKLCVLINSDKYSNHPCELYSERKKIIHFFEQLKSNDFDFYGHFWKQELYKNYKGVVDDHFMVLRNYRFCICYENMHHVNGYITEKIFNCFMTGCIPVYLGATNITEYIPKGCFIDRRDFATDQELYEFIKAMTYEDYMLYVRNILAFYETPIADKFTPDYFCNCVVCGIIHEIN